MKRARGELKSLRIATGRLAGLRIVAAVALAALVFAAGCNHDEAVAPPPLPEVTVAQAVTESVADYIDFTGNTAAIDSVNLVARVEGYLEQIHFTDGALVKKNDLLFTIQQDQYKAQLLQAEAQVATAKAALWHAKTELARYSGLYVKGAASAT
ncbi:MAG: biotin/lipoyl-binding protein, partial [Candidatus Binataceae bacterium]